MNYGKEVCKTLKGIRQEIADKNEIAYTSTECHVEEECQGTCPKCEAELKYIENELYNRKLLGKAATVAGIATVSFGMAVMSATTISSCAGGILESPSRPEPPHIDTIPLDSNGAPTTVWYENNGENP